MNTHTCNLCIHCTHEYSIKQMFNFLLEIMHCYTYAECGLCCMYIIDKCISTLKTCILAQNMKLVSNQEHLFVAEAHFVLPEWLRLFL